MVIRRGSIYWCELDPVCGHEQGATRPVVVVWSDRYSETMSPLVAVVPLTPAKPKSPVHLALATDDTGLKKGSTALADHARFIDRSRLRATAIGPLGPESRERLDQMLARLFGRDD